MSEPSTYDAMVLAGGGCRCFWQVGFYETVAPELNLRPKQVAAVSAGSAMACMLFSGTVEQGLEYFTDRAGRNERNIYPENLWGDAPVFPHEEIYRETILHACDQAALDRLRQGPDVRVLLSRPPEWLGSLGGVAVGFLAYEAEKLLSPSVHPELARRLGFSSEVVSLATCETPAALAEVILQSSCTPPFTPVYLRDEVPVLDGGLVDNVPVSALTDEAENVLVLLTRRYPDDVIPAVAGRTYVQPSESIPVEKWDYASPDLVLAALDLGRRDGESFLSSRAAG
ncbi:MAG: patatin-like phospholipase family protein [Candidatus Binatia bacterium]|nr:patatin-like phospholipase family protein [Candidatus Binatia bacterium]